MPVLVRARHSADAVQASDVSLRFNKLVPTEVVNSLGFVKPFAQSKG